MRIKIIKLHVISIHAAATSWWYFCMVHNCISIVRVSINFIVDWELIICNLNFGYLIINCFHQKCLDNWKFEYSASIIIFRKWLMYILKYMDSLSLIEEMATHNSHSQNAKLNGVYIYIWIMIKTTDLFIESYPPGSCINEF